MFYKFISHKRYEGNKASHIPSNMNEKHVSKSYYSPQYMF